MKEKFKIQKFAKKVVAIALATVTVASIVTTATPATTASAASYSKTISKKSDARVTELLEVIETQAGASSTKNGKSLRKMVEYFLFESKYKAIGGKKLPWTYSNASYKKTASYTFTDGKYSTKLNNTQKGCNAYGIWVARSIHGSVKKSNGTEANVLKSKDFTASKLKSLLTKYGQAGETIRMSSESRPHTVVFLAVSRDGKGFFYMDWYGSTSYAPGLRYVTFKNFVDDAKGRKCTSLSLAKYIDKENPFMFDLTKPGTNMGEKFTCFIEQASSGKVLAATKNGDVVLAKKNRFSAYQRWEFVKVKGTNYYFIKNMATGKYLDIRGCKNANDTQVWMYSFNGTAAQKFAVYGLASKCVIKCSNSISQVIDVNGGGKIHTWQYKTNTSTATTNQTFRINKSIF